MRAGGAAGHRAHPAERHDRAERNRSPVAPTDTIGFHGTGGILTDIGPGSPGRSMTINLGAKTGGLTLDSAMNGPVSLTLDVGVTPDTAP